MAVPTNGAGARRAAPVVLPPAARASTAFAIVAGECMEHWRSNARAVIDARDVEALHQTRVGVRRLRSAYALFRRTTLGGEPEFVATAAELRVRALPLGRARDLDVLIDSPLTAHLGRTETRRLGELRDAAYDDVVSLLTGSEWLRLVGRVEAFLGGAPWHLRADPPARVVARAALERRWDRVARRGRRLRRMSPAERHGVRIEAKKLRYGAQFFASLYAAAPGTEPLAFAETVAVLQDALGELNDLRAARELLAALGARPPADCEPDLVEGAAQAWEDVAALRPFWR